MSSLAPKMFMDRTRSTRDDTPNVLGYSANIGKNFNETVGKLTLWQLIEIYNFLGNFVYTKADLSTYQYELRHAVALCIERLCQNRGHMPRKIVIYNNGLIEGQY